jgi:hypothetical protein
VHVAEELTCSWPCAWLVRQRLGETQEHLDDTVVSGAQLLIAFVGDVIQISGEKQLVADLACRSAGDTHKLTILLALMGIGPFQTFQTFNRFAPFQSFKSPR